LYRELAESFDNIDEVIITDIYAAGEKEIKGISSKLIIDCLKERNIANAKYIKEKKDVVKHLLSKNVLSNGDVVITLGAGDIKKVSEALYTKL